MKPRSDLLHNSTVVPREPSAGPHNSLQSIDLKPADARRAKAAKMATEPKPTPDITRMRTKKSVDPSTSLRSSQRFRVVERRRSSLSHSKPRDEATEAAAEVGRSLSENPVEVASSAAQQSRAVQLANTLSGQETPAKSSTLKEGQTFLPARPGAEKKRPLISRNYAKTQTKLPTSDEAAKHMNAFFNSNKEPGTVQGNPKSVLQSHDSGLRVAAMAQGAGGTGETVPLVSDRQVGYVAPKSLPDRTGECSPLIAEIAREAIFQRYVSHNPKYPPI